MIYNDSEPQVPTNWLFEDFFRDLQALETRMERALKTTMATLKKGSLRWFCNEK